MEQDPQKVWFTADTHFGHASMLKYGRGGVFVSTSDMNDWIITQWNKNVRQGDTVFILGDVSFLSGAKTAEILARLHGRLYLVRGNHDDGLASYNERRFVSVDHYKSIKLGGRRIILSHYPLRSWMNMHYGSWHLHGHTHGNVRPYGRSVDVGMDSPHITGAPTYQPYHFSEIERFMASRPFESEDHHQE